MIGFKLQGRLGNQMFQFAFAYALAKKRKQPFFILNGSSTYLLDYFVLNGFKCGVLRNKLQNILFRLGTFKPKTLIQIGHENIENVLEESEKCKLLDGYFQSELFFKDFEADVKKLFEIKEEHQTEFESKYAEVFQAHKTIAVHIRRTDYLTWERGEHYASNAALPFYYVEQFLEKFDLSKYKVLFISDDIAAVEKRFGKNSNFNFESNSAIVDFQILLHADVLCISNSSFSWWGAYLNPKSGKQVFAPDYWLGNQTVGEYPKDVICKDWQRHK